MHYVIICITHRFARAAAASSIHHGSRCSVDDLFYSAPTVRRALHALWQHDDDIHGAAGSAQRAWGRGGADAQCAPPARPPAPRGNCPQPATGQSCADSGPVLERTQIRILRRTLHFIYPEVPGLSGRGVTRWISSQEIGVRILDGTKKLEISSDGICK